MKILIACEFSATVREAFALHGHDAWSCDLLPTDIPGQHLQCDVREIIFNAWDLVIAHPPCDHLAVSGARWFPEKRADGRQQKGIDFFMLFTKLKCKYAIENPIGIMSTLWKKPSQIIQPWMFGHGETKATCLWLHGLPLLKATNVVTGREQKCWKMGPSPDRWKLRSKTYQGIADAMAEQWGGKR